MQKVLEVAESNHKGVISNMDKLMIDAILQAYGLIRTLNDINDASFVDTLLSCVNDNDEVALEELRIKVYENYCRT